MLASLLSCILDLSITAADVTVTNTELPRVHEGGKLASVDVRVKLSDGKHINIELQVNDEHDMERRSIYYLSRLYTDQMYTRMKFKALEKTIAINILDFSFLKYTEYHNCYRLKNIRNNDELTDVFEIHFIELPCVEIKNNMKDLWMMFLKAENEEDLEMLANENPIMEKAVNKLIYVSADEQLRYELDMREKAELDYWSAIGTSYDRGEAKGIEEGIEKGEKKKAYEVANNALKMGLAVDETSKLTGLTPEEVEKLRCTE